MKLWSKPTFFSIFILPIHLIASSPLKVEVSAKAAILMNAETGAVLWEKNASSQVFPASTTKVFTALYAIEKMGHALDEMVEASHNAVCSVPVHVRRAIHGGHPPYRLEFGGTHMGLKVGEMLPLRALFYGLMLCSGNDAANVIAESASGNIPQFMEELNHFVRAKGCKNTLLRNPHGLYHAEHRTTAYDLAIFSREFLKNSFLREVVKATRYVRPQTNKQSESVIPQYNALLKPGKFYYPKAMGIKTGYIAAAGFTLVSAAEDENRKLIAVILGCEKIEQRYSDAIALFEAGFNEKKVSRTLFSKGYDLFSCPIEGGKTPLQAHFTDNVILEYYPSEEPAFKTAVQWHPLTLPIHPGALVAHMQITTQEGRIMKSAPLYAVKAVEGTMLYQANTAWKRVKRGLNNNLTLMMASIGLLILGASYYYTHRPRKRSKFHKVK